MSSPDKWLPELSRTLLDVVDHLDDDMFAEPSLLPGWTRQHVIGHVHHNAEALRRLVSWAATGVESRMYASPDQRASEIERAAALGPSRLRLLVRESSEALERDLGELDAVARSRVVVTAQGRSVPGEEIAWMRVREVAVHAVDLDAGVTFDDLPRELLVRLGAEALVKHSAEMAPELASWLTGRSDVAPALGRWL